MSARSFVAPVLGVLLACAGAALGATANVPTLPPSALHPGQAAIVRTVFAGDSIETFEAEILGVLPGGASEGDVILARATSARVVQTGVAQGMSGSPVYVDGKLIGALSSGWSFSKEPIFGITPIADMLDVLDRPESANPDGTSGPTGVDPQGGSPRVRGLAWSDDTLPPAVPANGGTRPTALGLPLATGGLAPGGFERVREMFAPFGLTVTPGGRAKGAPGRAAPVLRPGSPVAVDVLRGDLNFSAIGTVTYVDGDRVLIFGHPFFQSGEVRLPLSSANIVGILPSVATSFKLGVPGVPVGVATQDRRPAVAGRLGGVPSLMPFSVNVAQPGTARAYHFQTIEDRGLLPQLIAAAAMNSVLEAGATAAQLTLRWSLTAWRGGRALRVHDVAAGEGPLNDMVGGITAPLRFLYNNPFTRFALDSARIDVRVAPGRDEWTLRAASLGAASARPGDAVLVHAEVERWRGERRRVDLTLVVPEELPAGHYSLWLGGGSEFDRMLASRLPTHFRPASLEDGWQRLAALHASDALYAGLWAHAPEISGGGDDLPELPSSAVPLLASPLAVGDRSRRSDWALVHEQSSPWTGALHGELLIDLNVDPNAPR